MGLRIWLAESLELNTADIEFLMDGSAAAEACATSSADTTWLSEWQGPLLPQWTIHWWVIDQIWLAGQTGANGSGLPNLPARYFTNVLCLWSLSITQIM